MRVELNQSNIRTSAGRYLRDPDAARVIYVGINTEPTLNGGTVDRACEGITLAEAKKQAVKLFKLINEIEEEAARQRENMEVRR